MQQQMVLLVACVAVGRALSVSSVRAIPANLPECTEGEELLVGLGQIKCRERTGDAVIPDAKEIASELLDLLGSLMDPTGDGANGGDSMMADVEAHMGLALAALASLQQSMRSNQVEIDLMAQSLLPEIQRLSLHYGKAVQNNRDRTRIIAEQIHQLSEALPRDQFVELQHQHTAVTSALSAMRSNILTGKMPLPSADPTALLSIAGVIAQKTVHLALQTAADKDGEVDARDLANVLQLDASASQDGSSLVGLTLRDRTVMTIDSLIASFKDLRALQSKQLGATRDDWSADLDDHQRTMDEVTDSQHAFQHLQSESVLAQRRAASYGRAVTGLQYRLLAAYAAAQTGLARFGTHLDRAVRMKAALPPVIRQLLHLVESGDVPYHPAPFLGCDGAGGAVDVCGVCRGANNTCLSCSGIPNNSDRMDVCGSCGDGLAHDCSYFCDGKADSGVTEDVCGVCGGTGVLCSGCDGMPHSPLRVDMCGVCGGDGASCFADKGCGDPLKHAPCASVSVACPFGQVVAAVGFKSCCFDPAVDCITPVQANHA